MATKTLSIIVRAVDQATAPLRAATAQVAASGDKTAAASAKVQKSLQGINSTIKTVVAAIAGYATFAAAKLALTGVIDAIGNTTKTLEELGDAAERLRIPVETLSELRYAAKLSNIEFDTLADAVATAEKNIAQFATTGGGRAADTIKRLGVSLYDSKGAIRSIGDLLPELFDAIGAAPEAEQGLLTQKLFGSNADKFLLIIRQGGAEFRRLAEEGRRLGVVFTPEQVATAQRYRDAIDRISEAWLGLKTRVVEQVGPFLTDLLNKGAVFVSAIPDMIATIAKKLRDALDENSAAGQIARLQISALINRAIQLGVVAVKGGFRIIAATLAAGVPALIEVLYPIVKGGVARLVYGVTDEVLRPWLETIQQAGGIWGGWATGLRVALAGAGEPLKASSRIVEDAVKGSVDVINASLSNSGSNIMLFARAWTDTADEVGTAAGGVVSAIKNLSGATEAIAKHAIPTLDEVRSKLENTPREAKSDWEEFTDAIASGFANVRQRIQKTMEFVTDLTERVLDSIASGLSNAIVDAVSGVKSFGEAMRDVASQVLKMIAQMILQFLILRAITGALFGGAGGGDPAAVGGGWEGGGAAFALQGAYVDGSGVKPSGHVAHMLGGGMVPGPRLSRDSFPALLAGGEAVLNQAATARAGGRSAIDYANSGGTLAPAGGGITIVSNVTVNAGGGGGGGGMTPETLLAIKTAAAEGVLEALRRSPRYRGEMRGLIGGA